MTNRVEKQNILGYTIVEIIVVIVVIGVLTTISTLSYSSWQKSTYVNAVKSDGINIGAAMENSQNFSTSGYPTIVSSIFTASKDISISGGSSDGGKTYCVDITSLKDSSINYYVDSSASNANPKSGTCASRSNVLSAPSPVSASTASTTSINVTWPLVGGATGYNLQRASNASFTDALTIANLGSSPILPYLSTSLTPSKIYYYRVQTVNNFGSGPWSVVISAATSNGTIATPSVLNVSQNTAGNTTTYSWTAASCSVGQKARYQYQYTISPIGYVSGIQVINNITSLTLTTSTEGQNYQLSVQSQCYNVDAVSAWSVAGQASYHRPGTWKQIASGLMFSCGIASDDKAYCWGDNTYGQIGDNTSGTDRLVPVPVYNTGLLKDLTIKIISVGDYHACLVASDNNAYCWGRNNNGQIGDKTSGTNRLIPTAVDTSGLLIGLSIKTISTGNYNSCVIASDNNAYCWGDNSTGNTGNNNSGSARLSPVAVYKTGALNGLTIKSISVANGACVIASDNNAYCWGAPIIGDNTSGSARVAPVALVRTGALNGLTISSISRASSHSCAIASDNNAYCWGINSSGELGNNSIITSLVPTGLFKTGLLNGLTIKSITSGQYQTTCAIASDNNAYCWGDNAYGQIGDGTNGTDRIVPTAVKRTGTLLGLTIVSISESYSHTCAIASDKNAYCWGSGADGQIGDNSSSTMRLSPIKVTAPF